VQRSHVQDPQRFIERIGLGEELELAERAARVGALDDANEVLQHELATFALPRVQQRGGAGRVGKLRIAAPDSPRFGQDGCRLVGPTIGEERARAAAVLGDRVEIATPVGKRQAVADAAAFDGTIDVGGLERGAQP
jgi:hypothetical protein